jgi:glucokinase
MTISIRRNGAILAIDIGGTKIAICLVATKGGLISLRRVATDAHLGGKEVMNKIISLARQIYSESKEMDESLVPVAIGVSSAWLVYPENGSVVAYSYADLADWEDISIKNQLEDAIGLPTYIDGDASVMTLGEALLGAARDYSHVVGLTIGTGVGGGIVIDGKIYHGSDGFAGNFGHIIVDYLGNRRCPCGRYGCLEAYASGPSIVMNFIERIGENQLIHELGFDPTNIGVKDINELAQTGQIDALSAIQDGARFLGIGVATLINIFNPDVVVIGGGISQIGEIYFREVRSTVIDRALPFLADTPILPAKYGAESNLVGAACLAWQGMALE